MPNTPKLVNPSNEQSKPTHLDLFSGLGGFTLAAEWAGFQTIGFAEIDPYASAVLNKHWPDIPNYGDVRNVPPIQCDLITGGFPCQPFSCAGKRRGKEDDRYLWPAMLEVIARCRPAWVLGENVAGIINMELDRCIADLEKAGYKVQPLIVPACAVDARHRRDRVWIVAHSESNRRKQAQLRGQEPSGIADTNKDVAYAVGEQIARQGQRGLLAKPAQCGETVPDSEKQLSERCRNSRARRDGFADACEAIPDSRCSRREEFNTPGFAAKPGHDTRCHDSGWAIWPVEPELGRVANGIPRRVDRLKGLGNAIVPQVAYEILKAIRQLI